MKPDIKGLTKLADHLMSVPRREFDMDEWVETTPCGMKACIAGHAALLFPHRMKHETKVNELDASSWITHKRTERDGEYAFADAFKISDRDAEDLCYNVNVSTPKQAARAVRALVGRLEREMVKAGK